MSSGTTTTSGTQRGGFAHQTRALAQGGIAVAIAAAAFAAGSAVDAPLVGHAWASAFVLIASWVDMRTLRIPNAITFPTIFAALAFSAWNAGLLGVTQALLGAAIAFAVLCGPYAIGALGAGDVKAVIALGAWIGPLPAAGLALRSLVVSALLGVAWLAWRRELRQFAERWLNMLATTTATRRFQYVSPAEGSAARTGIPFATAVGLGLVWQWLSGGPS